MYDIGSFVTIWVFLFITKDSFYFSQIVADGYSVPSVRDLAGFYDPNVAHFFLPIFLFFPLFKHLFVVLDFFLSLFVIPHKIFKFLVISAFLDMKGQWQNIKRIQTQELIVLFHIIKQCFFVAQMPVKWKVIATTEKLWFLNFYDFFLFLWEKL